MYMEENVRDAVFGNDVGKLVEMMEWYHFLKDGTPPHFKDDNRHFAMNVLRHASMAASFGKLEDAMAEEIIARLAYPVHIGGLLRVVNVCTKSTGAVIPEATLARLSGAEAAQIVEQLNYDEFSALISYGAEVGYKVAEELPKSAILHRIYAEQRVCTGMVLAQMAMFLKESYDVSIARIFGYI